jgi:hypothetical protein
MFDGIKIAIADILREEHHRFASPDPSGVAVEIADKICRRILKMKPDPAHEATTAVLNKANVTIAEQAALIESLQRELAREPRAMLTTFPKRDAGTP